MAYLGNTPTTQSFTSGTDYFNGTGSQTAFTLTRVVSSVNDIEVLVNNVEQQPNSYIVSGSTLTFSVAPSSGTSNIYVRYLSTTTQVITPSPATITNASFANNISSIPFAVGGPVGGGNSSIMKNRIINGAMVIDQRNAGASVTPATATVTYTLDRFWAYQDQASKFSVQQNAGSVTALVGFKNYLGVTSLSAYTVGSAEVFALAQPIEGYNVADLGWGTVDAKTVTLSFWVRSSLTGTFGGALRNSAANRSYPFTYSIPVANTWTAISVTIAGDTTGTWLTTNGIGITVIWGLGVGSTYSGTAGSWAGTNYLSATGATSVVGTSGATFYITGVQLEVGSSATGFEYVNYQTSLANCQRYYQQLNDPSGGSAVIAPAYCYSTTGCRAVFALPVTMRSAPNFTTAGTFQIATNGATDISSLTLAASTPYTVVLDGVTSGQTTGYGGGLRPKASATAVVQFSAEL